VKQTAVYALTREGGELGKMLAREMGGDLYMPAGLAQSFGAVPFERLSDVVADRFGEYPRHVFITAAGIAVRMIAPHIASKDRDPAVVVLDQAGRFAVSLLSGHLGGANDLAREAAFLTGGQAVVTTATDTAGLTAVDVLARRMDMTVLNVRAVKGVNGAVLRGEPVQVFDPEGRLLSKGGEDPFPIERVLEEGAWAPERPGVWVGWGVKEPEASGLQLVLHPRCLVAGVGCNRGTGADEILGLIRGVFTEASLALGSLKCLASIEAKRDEEGLILAARGLGVPVSFEDKDRLSGVRVPNPSAVVEKHMGVESVCEAAALATSGGGSLLVAKKKSRNATLAVALEGSRS